ncbi:hypothetical protein [Desulfonatronospira thiodismutans]|uniref:hypothetical protein n=1 Tax=Desulfonatronospira thiodismutans TaxID=488939 RepID=UPI0001974D58|nr:hypothetical protein [Desulfonatronospira thiodismutans]
MPQRETLIPKHGGYRNLKSFQLAQLVYDVTVRFCDRYINRFSRTKDQMIVTIQGVPEPAWGQSPRHLLRTITKITDAKFCVPAQPVLSEGQSPSLVPVITTEDLLNGYR